MLNLLWYQEGDIFFVGLVAKLNKPIKFIKTVIPEVAIAALQENLSQTRPCKGKHLLRMAVGDTSCLNLLLNIRSCSLTQPLPP